MTSRPITSPAVITGTVQSDDGNINLRTRPVHLRQPCRAPSPTARKLSLVCGVVGSAVIGTVRSTTQWNRLDDGRYISHAYVVTPTLHLCKDAANVPTSTRRP